MTQDEVKRWYDQMDEGRRIQIIMEWEDLKHRLCERTLGIPTGAEDWIDRAVKGAERLRECERQFRKMVNSMSELLEDATWRTNFRECTNCMGRKTVGGESCCICGGTGVRRI